MYRSSSRSKKHLYIRLNKVYSTKNDVSNNQANKYEYGGEEAQMLILGAILVSVMVITLSVYVSELSNVTSSLPIEESTELLPVYENIREGFGHALKDLIDSNNCNYSWISKSVESTSESFFIIESQHMRYFDAELIDVHYLIDKVKVTVELSLHDDTSYISEEVIYDLNI